MALVRRCEVDCVLIDVGTVVTQSSSWRTNADLCFFVRPDLV
jgi:hypothetical protein